MNQDEIEIRRTRVAMGMKLADQLIAEADRDRAAELVGLFDKEGGEFPPSYLLGVATLAAHAMARSSDPLLLRAALIIMMDRQFADAEHLRRAEEQIGEEAAALANQEVAGSA